MNACNHDGSLNRSPDEVFRLTEPPMKLPKKKRGKGKVPRAQERIAKRGFVIPSPDDVKAVESGAGGWSAAQLAEWGIAWPPLNGWRAYLTNIWHEYGSSVVHDTVFDKQLQARWLKLRSQDAVRLTNPKYRYFSPT